MSEPRFDPSGFDPENFDPDDLDRVIRDAEQAMSRLADVQEELAGIRGRGTGAGDLIDVVTDATGRVERIDLNPRVMRMDSRTLAEELMSTIRSAQEDGERRARELLAGAGLSVPGSGSDFGEVEKRMTRNHESFAREMNRRMAGGPGRPADG
ncbi:YbaB/EbfC family nucleoid-associated protein [Planomonospora sp. ID82291]|uniref:YbaB/EbfC family nucleoid-associated protein n=1 Tax=Planomonospora sp. ID82291 TaxID=2738136 RepID=UPI0018C39CB7|nr:YbaB/EbfC family nucleoid-associated protein [Planomonospora sp. ID82291]MBG0815336.1 YbaB/EbfC family nucleoid-associated protein [Planomonospora sp. ID82291]